MSGVGYTFFGDIFNITLCIISFLSSVQLFIEGFSAEPTIFHYSMTKNGGCQSGFESTIGVSVAIPNESLRSTVPPIP